MSKLDQISEDEIGRFAPAAPVRALLERHPGARVLDWGCGRGDLVLWMRQRGWDAVGIDIDPRYVENGRKSFSALGVDPTALAHASELRSIASNQFDIVVSYMVLEHVTDLAATARDMRKALRPGGVGLHLYPGRWRPVEAHVGVPFAHVFQGRTRRRILELFVRRGWDRRSHWGLAEATNSEIVEKFSTYLDESTRYRSRREILRTFRDAGFSARISMTDHRLARPQGPLPESLLRVCVAPLVTSHLRLDG